MNTNPYQPPRSNPNFPMRSSAERIAALRALRISLCILLVPGICNFLCFHFLGNFSPDGIQITEFERTVNLIALCLLVVSIWFWGLTFLERVAAFIYWALGKTLARRRGQTLGQKLGQNSSVEQWQTQLHQVLRRSPTFAFLGAILWTLWTLAIYLFQLNFFVVSLPIGFAAHVLAACLYLPLFYRWYQLEQNGKR